jgi:kinesin family member 6/9
MSDDVQVDDFEALDGNASATYGPSAVASGSRPPTAASTVSVASTTESSMSGDSDQSRLPVVPVASSRDSSEPPKPVEIFVRCRPLPAEAAESDDIRLDRDANAIFMRQEVDHSSGKVNNTRQSYNFQFSGVMPPEIGQGEVFEKVVGRSVTSVIDGYNATVFAYGQTGSGKTWTITGGKRYSERGLIPRALSTIFDELKKRTDITYSCQVSYMEIYNEVVYDLLNTENEGQVLEDLPVVHIREDNSGGLQFVNLQKHTATKEEEALNVLFLGDTNRTIAETAMNEASSRSHAIFTVFLDARKDGADTIRRSKLNIVDLAGSERIAKTGATGELRKEATNINLSLHYLEQVIVALGERKRRHIPYRNSKLTSVLRDSLGGNCVTTMIATISMEFQHIPESIATCNFARRVGRMKNTALVNEEIDPKLAVMQLKTKVQELKNQLLLAGDDDPDAPLSAGDLVQCQSSVDFFLEDSSPDARLSVDSAAKVRECFRLLKIKVVDGRTAQSGGASLSVEQQDRVKEIISGLRKTLAEREREIEVLKTFIRPGESKDSISIAPPSHSEGKNSSMPDQSSSTASGSTTTSLSNDSVKVVTTPGGSAPKDAQLDSESKVVQDVAKAPPSRKEAFREFSRSYPDAKVVEENNKLLRKKLAQAKNLSRGCRGLAEKVNVLRSQIEQIRMRAVLAKESGNSSETATAEMTPEEKEALARLEKVSRKYKEFYGALTDIRTEVTRLEALTKQEKKALLHDFERWFRVMYPPTALRSTSSEVDAAGDSRDSSRGGEDTDSVASSTDSGTTSGLEQRVADDPDVQAFYRKLHEVKRRQSGDQVGQRRQQGDGND